MGHITATIELAFRMSLQLGKQRKAFTRQESVREGWLLMILFWVGGAQGITPLFPLSAYEET